MALSQRRGCVHDMPNLYLAIHERPLMKEPQIGYIVVWDYSDRNCLLESNRGKFVNNRYRCSILLKRRYIIL